VVLARLATPLSKVLSAAATGALDQLGALVWSQESAVTVVIAAAGYPGTPETGEPIIGAEVAGSIPGVYVLHAGTALDGSGRLVSAGGRVLSVVGLGPDLAAARDRAYAGVGAIRLEGAQHRTDIALRAAS
jgi:phosphoribosylamine--glycine ligase